MRFRSVYGHLLPVLAILVAPHAFAACPLPQFGAPIALTGAGFGLGPQSIVAGDFNNDGKADLLVADSTGANVFLADGTGHFQNKFRSGTSVGHNAVAILHANNDANLDFAMVHGTRGFLEDVTTLTVHLGDGTGNFDGPYLVQEVGLQNNPRALVSGDFNGDHKADLVVAFRTTTINEPRLLLGIGDGAGGFTWTNSPPAVDEPIALGVGDFDADGHSDLAVHTVRLNAEPPLSVHQDVRVLYGGKATGFGGNVTTLDLGETPFFEWFVDNSNSIAVARLNGDQLLDLAVQNRGAGTVSVFFATAPRQFGAPTTYSVGGAAVAAGDIDGDDHQDLVIADPVMARVCVLLHDGTASAGYGSPSCVPSGGYSTGIAIERFNSTDGSVDVAVANKTQNSAAVLLNTCGPPTDIEATGIEVTQVVQDLANSVMLVAGKRTIVRLHVSSNFDQVPVTASLQVLDGNGAPLGNPLKPSNTNALVSVRTSPDRARLDDAFYFELPSAATRAGTIRVRGIVNPDGTVVEDDHGNNTITSTPLTFVPTKPLKLRVVDYSYKKPNGIVVQNDPGDLAKLEADVRSRLPIDVLTFTHVAVYDSLPPAEIVDSEDRPEDADKVLSWVQNYRATKEPENVGVLYYVLTNAVKGRSDNIPGWNAVGTWGDAAHEIGHLFGRRHVPCSGTEEGNDPSYPYPGGRIGGPAGDPTRYFGLNTAPNLPEVVPATAGDLLSYCSPRWLSNYNLTAMWSYRQSLPGLAPGFRRLASTASSVTGDFLAIYGTIDLRTEDLSLTGVTRLATAGEIPPLVPGPYHIRLLDEQGTMLADHPFTARATTDGGMVTLFGQVVDFTPGTRTVQIFSDTSNRILGSVPVSANAPTVTITSSVAGLTVSGSDVLTLEWTGVDADQDLLHYDVLYSADNRSTWRLLRTGLSNSSAVIESSELDGTAEASTAYFRVVASDGVLTGADEEGPFTVSDKAPSVQVLRPLNATTFVHGQTVTLEAWALDLEDGSLDDSRFSWSSDRNGPLGQGRLFHALGLASGIHTITLSATDRSGEVGRASFQVNVGPSAIPNRAPAFSSVSPSATVKEGTTVNLSATATDPDAGQAILVTASGHPAGLATTAGSSVMPEAARATISGVLGSSDGDQNPTVYTIEWLASDGTLSASASTELSVMDVVPMGFDLTPGTLNLRSMGRWVTAYLEPESPYTPADIDIESIALLESVPMDPSAPAEIGDHDGDGISDLAVKIDRAALELVLEAGDHVEVVVTGTMAGRYFRGTDTIRVIRARVTAPAEGQVLEPGVTTTVAWTTPSGVAIQSVALLSSLDAGTTWTLEASDLPNVGSHPWSVPNVSTTQARVAVVLVESADETGYLVNGVVGTSGTFSIGSVTAVGEEPGTKAQFALRVVRPNPTRDELRVSFGLPDARAARIEVFDVSGRRVAAREVGGFGPGFHTITMDARRELPSGVYLVRLTQAGKKLTTRAVVVR